MKTARQMFLHSGCPSYRIPTLPWVVKEVMAPTITLCLPASGMLAPRKSETAALGVDVRGSQPPTVGVPEKNSEILGAGSYFLMHFQPEN